MMSKEQVVVNRKKKKKVKIFPIVNVVVFLIISFCILLPIWKVIVDSFDAMAGYGLAFWPRRLSVGGYNAIVTNASLYTPFLISCFVTVAGTALGRWYDSYIPCNEESAFT